MAILNFHFDLAAYLIEKGADVNYSDTKGRTALYTAVDMHRLNISTRPNPVVTDKLAAGDIVRMLLERGASPNAQLTAMIPARGVLDIGDFVLGAGTTPFLRAAKGSDLELMRLLVEHGADPRIATRGGMTPLMAAAGVGWMDGKTRGTPEESMEAVQFCLDRGLDINAATGLGETALHGAAGRGNNAIIKFLAELGADPLAKDKRGLTPRDIALGKGGGIGGVRAPDPETLALLESLEEARKSSDLVAKREQ
jgi:ankyrin repeat protein